jgi:hypothetical protein
LGGRVNGFIAELVHFPVGALFKPLQQLLLDGIVQFGGDQRFLLSSPLTTFNFSLKKMWISLFLIQ